MIDIHCHILPCLDDGAQNLEEAIEMAKQAWSRGVREIVATPHCIPGSRIIDPKKIKDGVDELNNILEEKQINVGIHGGAEVFLDPSIPELLDKEQLLTIWNKYILLELPFIGYPSWIHQMLFEVSIRGFKAIIAHPERNISIGDNPNLTLELIEKGALIQVNSGSLLGHFGRKTKKTAEILLSHNMVHFIGSDAHNTRGRSINLNKLDIGKELTFDNPERLRNGDDVVGLTPRPYKAKRGLARFFSRQ